MDLPSKFRTITSGTLSDIYALIIDHEYSFVRAERLHSAGMLYLRDIRNFDKSYFLYRLPKRYVDVFSDGDTENINLDKVWLYLIYKGICTFTNSVILDIE